MPGFDGTGPRGMGPMTGGGRGFCAVPSPTTWPAYGMPFYGMRPTVSDAVPLRSQMTREQELDFLKTQTQVLKKQLEQIESSIQEIEGESK